MATRVSSHTRPSHVRLLQVYIDGGPSGMGHVERTMEGRSGYCISRLCGGDADVASRLGRIMLRFRPIAPKPTVPGPVKLEDGSDNGTAGRSRRRKRKNNSSSGIGKETKSGKRSGRRITAAAIATPSSSEEEAASVILDPITLPLMPVTPERKDDAVVAPTPRRPVGSVVAVESVEEAWGDWRWMCRCGVAEAKRRLEDDTWPAFVTDAEGRVTWTNAAYRGLVGGGEEVRVGVVAREKVSVPPSTGEEAFTCRVRLRYAGGRSMTAYCDVWRLADGGLVWRIDTDAALTLSSKLMMPAVR